MQDPNLVQWKNIKFNSAPNHDIEVVNFVILIFPSIEIGINAMKVLKTWDMINLAFTYDDSESIIHLYDGKTETYLLKTNLSISQIPYLSDFLVKKPNNKRFALTCGIIENGQIGVNNDSIIALNAYLYTHKQNFHYQNIARLD